MYFLYKMNTEFWNLMNSPWEDYGRKEKNKDDPIWAIINIYVKYHKETPCRAILNK
jgi:hypothetical protein